MYRYIVHVDNRVAKYIAKFLLLSILAITIYAAKNCFYDIHNLHEKINKNLSTRATFSASAPLESDSTFYDAFIPNAIREVLKKINANEQILIH